MIEVRELTKRYGTTLAVDGLSFSIAPGQVTGFLGPNGAGKTTTMRLMLGLQAPTHGTVTFDGIPYRAMLRPLLRVGSAWNPPPSTPVAAPTATCWPSPSPTASPPAGSARCSRSSG